MNFTDFKLAWWQMRGQASRAWLFIFCVAIGVSARVSVGSFMGQVSRAVSREARSLLSADLEVAGASPLSAEKRRVLEKEAGPGARFQRRASFLSVITSADPVKAGSRRSRLAQIAAVEAGYPFYGKLRVRLDASGVDTQDLSTLESGEPVAILQPELLPQLGIRIGSRIKVGRLRMRVAGVLVEEPGLGGGAFSLGPKVLIGMQQLKATGLTGFGSRVNYTTLLALPQLDAADRLAKRLKSLWKASGDTGTSGFVPPADTVRVRTFKDAENNLQRFFERLADFLNLASLMALLLGGVGVASVVRAFVREQMPAIGVLRTLGASGGRLSRIYFLQCLGLGLAGGLLGAVLGSAIQNLLPVLLKDFLPLELHFGLDGQACAVGIGLGLLTSALFSLLPIAEIRRAHPGELFRDEAPTAGLDGRFWALAVFGALLFLGIGSWEAKSFLRGGGFVGALIAGALLIWGASAFLLPRLSRLRLGGVGGRHGLSNLSRPGLKPTASVIALGCAALHLGILAIYQHSLLAELDPGKKQSEIPGLFLIDVQSDQVEPVRAFLKSTGDWKLNFSPMVKARYRGKNRETVKEGEGWSREDETDKQMTRREQNLSYRKELRDGETIVGGKWMDPAGSDLEASLEEWFAKRLGVKLGDRIAFDVQGVRVEAMVTSLRKVHWASFQPNFFILLSPWALESAPQVWIGSVAGLDGGQRQELQTQIVERFPNVTIFDVAEGSRKIMDIMRKISWAIRAVAVFSLFTGLVVLAGIALSTARARRQEAALLKTLGAGRATILASLGMEFGALGLLSGGLGIGLALIFAWVLLERMLEIPYHVPWTDVFVLLTLMTGLCAATGMLASLKAIRAKPLEVLREE